MAPPIRPLRRSAWVGWIAGHTGGGAREAAFAATILVMSRVLRGSSEGATLALEIALCAGAALTGRWPRAGAFFAGLALSVLAFLPGVVSSLAVFAMYIPIFALASRGMRRLTLAVTTWYLVMAVILIGVRQSSDLPSMVAASAILGLLALIAWVTGRLVHQLRRQVGALDQARIDAVVAQRRMIARDLHDSVAHSTATIVMRAEQAKIRGVSDPDLVADLDYIIGAGRQGIRDLRSILGALRRVGAFDEAELTASPWRVGALPELVASRIEELTRHGFTVTSSVPDDLEDLPHSTREALGKLLVEATSNMVKHARPASPCTVMIEREPDAVSAAFINQLPVRPHAGDQRGGLGLIGAQERIEAVGGEFDTRTSSGTWILEARLPTGL